MSKKSSDYITVNKATYEKLSSSSQTVRLEIRQDILNALDSLIEKGHFVSRGDAIRHILRVKLEESDRGLNSSMTEKKPKQPKGPKKPPNPPRQPQRPPQRLPQRRGR